MRKVNFLFLLLLAVLGSSCRSEKSYEGEWFGLSNKALLTVRFNADSTLDIVSEASSNMSFSCAYKINENVDPVQIDLTGAAGGMTGLGIMRINEEQSLEMCLNFGIPGMTERPVSFKADPMSMTMQYYKLCRDKENVLGEIAYSIKAPEEAALAYERNRRLGAGINLNGVVDGNLHPGYQRDAPLKDDEIIAIAEAGFQSIRFDICWVKHCQQTAPYTIDPAFFEKVDHIVDVCLANDLAVSIDSHYYPYINMNEEDSLVSYEENFVRLEALWEQIAEHYKDYPDDMIYFDPLNEPNMRLGEERWNVTLRSLIKTIRKSNPNKTILVMTPSLGQSWTINYLDLPEDDWNIIVQFHYYMPHLFTHQGLAYAMADGVGQVDWQGTDEEKAQIEKDLDYVTRWSQTHHRPVNMGEYGAVNTATTEARARYLGFVLEAARKRDISSHLWGYRECFEICDPQTGKWIPEIMEAMNLKNKN